MTNIGLGESQKINIDPTVSKIDILSADARNNKFEIHCIQENI